MRLPRPAVVILVLLAPCNVVAPPTCPAAPTGNPTFTDPAATDDDFAFQGEYTGETAAGPVGVQVVALGDGKLDVVAYRGGLPGAGWTPPNSSATPKCAGPSDRPGLKPGVPRHGLKASIRASHPSTLPTGTTWTACATGTGTWTAPSHPMSSAAGHAHSSCGPTAMQTD